MSSAPSFPSPASASSPSRARASSSSLGLMEAAEVGSMTAMGLCVKERCSLAVNMKFGFTASAFRTQSLARCGLMCP